jgi:hypothetical protein
MFVVSGLVKVFRVFEITDRSKAVPFNGKSLFVVYLHNREPRYEKKHNRSNIKFLQNSERSDWQKNRMTSIYDNNGKNVACHDYRSWPLRRNASAHRRQRWLFSALQLAYGERKIKNTPKP